MQKVIFVLFLKLLKNKNKSLTCRGNIPFKIMLLRHGRHWLYPKPLASKL
jgi:hypothetical protein